MTVGKTGNVLTTEVYRKTTDTGLLLHYQSHVDRRYKQGLVKTTPVSPILKRLER